MVNHHGWKSNVQELVNSPMVQINDDYFEDLDEEKFSKIIDQIDKNQKPKPGS